MATSAINGENFPSRVAAEFHDADTARQAAELLIRQTGIVGHQVQLVDPGDPAIDRKLEPESRGIARTLVRSHAILGIAGLITGLIVGVILLATGAPLFAGSPWYTLGTLAVFGAIGGMLVAGLISMRPNHDHLLLWVKSATRKGCWFVLVHARDRDQEREAQELLKGMSDKVMVT